MSVSKKFLAIAAAAAIVLTVPVPAVNVSAAALSDYYYDDPVPYSMFDCYGIDGAQEKVERKFESATRKSIGLITFHDLEKITSLDLSDLGLESVPEVLEYMPRLRTLNLSNNRLRSNKNINDLDLSGDVALTSVDISNNYLTAVPSWFVALDASTKKIDNNLINTSGQRYLVANPSTYYFMVGDEVNENALKNKILASIYLSDGTELPDFFYDPEYPPYNEYDPDDTSIDDYYTYDLSIDDWNLSSFIDSRTHIVKDVTRATSVDVTVTLYTGSGSSNNSKTTVKIKLYFLNGSDPSSVKVRLETLISECKDFKKDDYTATSWNNFEAAYKTAQTIINYESADTDMLKRSLDGLQDAKNELVKGVSTSTKKVLNDLIATSKNFKEEDYSAASWAKFAEAVALMETASKNTNTSVNEANAAIKAYQDAQAGLTKTLLMTPVKAEKSDFEKIYGENRTITYTGVTRDGYKYTWTFNGTDIKEPKELDPEIRYTSAYEEGIRKDVGSASDYQIISFVQTGTFPGTAVITADVSGRYSNGTYRLYKWDTSAKKSVLVSDVTVTNGTAAFAVSEGGDYFISSVLQNFEMISNKFDIDHTRLTIKGPFKQKYTVADFRASLQNGGAVTVRAADGTLVSDSRYISTGMTASAANSGVNYTIIVPGDLDGDGNITALDAVQILRALVGEVTLDPYQQRAGDIDGNNYVRADDAVAILKYSVGIE